MPSCSLDARRGLWCAQASIATLNVTGGESLAPGGYADEELGGLITPSLEPAGFSLSEASGDFPGELGDVIRMGYRAFGFASTHAEFHTNVDFATTTSAAVLERAGRAIADALLAASNELCRA